MDPNSSVKKEEPLSETQHHDQISGEVKSLLDDVDDSTVGVMSIARAILISRLLYLIRVANINQYIDRTTVPTQPNIKEDAKTGLFVGNDQDSTDKNSDKRLAPTSNKRRNDDGSCQQPASAKRQKISTDALEASLTLCRNTMELIMSYPSASKTTVDNVVSHCIDLIAQAKPNGTLLTRLESIFWKGLTKKLLNLKDTLIVMLNRLKQDIDLSVQGSRDFDFIWNTCVEEESSFLPSFRCNDIEDTQLFSFVKKYAYLLANVTYLHRSSSEQSRKDKILLSAASILFLLRLSRTKQSSIPMGKNHTKTEDKNLKALKFMMEGTPTDQEKDPEDRINEILVLVSNAFFFTIPDSIVSLKQIEEKMALISEIRPMLRSTSFDFDAQRQRIILFQDLKHIYLKELQKNLDGSTDFESFTSFLKFVDEREFVSTLHSPLKLDTLKPEPLSKPEVKSFEMMVMSARSNKFAVTKCITEKDSLHSSLELDNWMNNVIQPSLRHIKPSKSLLSNFDLHMKEGKNCKNVIIPVLNQMLSKLTNDSIWQDPTPQGLDSAPSRSTAPTIVDDMGEMRPISHDDYPSHVTPSGRVVVTREVLGRAMVRLYYFALELILSVEERRRKEKINDKLMFNISFHKALITISFICISQANGGLKLGSLKTDHLPKTGHRLSDELNFIFHLFECSEYEYMKVNDMFLKALTTNSRSPVTLPSQVIQLLEDVEDTLLSSLLWSRKQEHHNGVRLSLPEVIEKISSSSTSAWPPKILRPYLPGEAVIDEISSEIEHGSQLSEKLNAEYIFVEFLFNKVLILSWRHLVALAQELDLPFVYLVPQIWYAYRYLLRTNIELLYDRHIDQMLMCTIYAVTKRMKCQSQLNFQKISEAYLSLNRDDGGDIYYNKIIWKAILCPKSNRTGTIINLYNEVFIPVMKKYLLNNERLKIAASQKLIKSESLQVKDTNIKLTVHSASTIMKQSTPRSRVLLYAGNVIGKELKLANSLLQSGENCIS